MRRRQLRHRRRRASAPCAVSWGHPRPTRRPRYVSSPRHPRSSRSGPRRRDSSRPATRCRSRRRAHARGQGRRRRPRLLVLGTRPLRARSRRTSTCSGPTSSPRSDADTARRLLRDPAFSPGAPGADASSWTRRHSRLHRHGRSAACRAGALDPVARRLRHRRRCAASPFADHLRALDARKGQRILDRVRVEPEATYAQYTARWEDMGHPAYSNPADRAAPATSSASRGTARSASSASTAAPACGATRAIPTSSGSGLPFGELGKGVAHTWKVAAADRRPADPHHGRSRRMALRYEVEQFAYPLHGPPAERRGDMPMVLLQQLTVTRAARARARRVPVSMTHRRQLPPYLDGTIVAERQGDAMLFRERGRRGVLLADRRRRWRAAVERHARLPAERTGRSGSTRPCSSTCPRTASRQFVVKLPSPIVTDAEAAALAAIDYATRARGDAEVLVGATSRAARSSGCRSRRSTICSAPACGTRSGCRAVTAARGPDVAIDLPYSNFAYSQTGTPWPVNQAVYVDYMLYDLRGYHAIAAEELRGAVPQQPGARRARQRLRELAGLHAGDALRGRAELPAVERSRGVRAAAAAGPARRWTGASRRSARALAAARGRRAGLVRGPLNDLTGQGVWAFNQAYLFAGLDLFGRALERHGHPRAAEARRRRGAAPRVDRPRRSAPRACGRRSSSCATARGRRTCRPKR